MKVHSLEGNRNQNSNTKMTSAIISSHEPALHLYPKSNKNRASRRISSLSFTSHFAGSRISVRQPDAAARRVNAGIAAFYSPATEETLYEVLGIEDTGITASDIKKAYKQMARKYHPDVSPANRVEEHTRRFILVHDAYETLSNPQSRALYDGALAAGRGFGSGYSAGRRSETMGWKSRWESQLDGLERRDLKRAGSMSWGARMRARA